MKIDAIDYIPHEGKMALLNEILEITEKTIKCSIALDKATIFMDELGNIPTWLGMEFMAQSIAAFAGVRAKEKGEPVQAGFLLGTRKMNIYQTNIELQSQLNCHAELIFQSDEMGSFDCKLFHEQTLLADAKINVYQPQNFMNAIQELKNV